jgi:hypothetical protein
MAESSTVYSGYDALSWQDLLCYNGNSYETYYPMACVIYETDGVAGQCTDQTGRTELADMETVGALLDRKLCSGGIYDS